MTRRVPHATLHLTIEGVIFDRERASPDLTLTLTPLGTQLPREEQARELTLKIGASEATLNEEGIAALKDFLEMRP